jgi:hypothetical protein
MLVIGICIDKLEPMEMSSPWLAATHVVAEPTLNHCVLPRLLSAWQIGGANPRLCILTSLFTILYKIHNTELNN